VKVRNEAETVGGVWFQVASLGLNSKFNKPKRKNPRQRQATLQIVAWYRLSKQLAMEEPWQHG
tara:strand:+ start:404 stop:592 length:189 start_codon:yes stop_codon:yes gene_type:complete